MHAVQYGAAVCLLVLAATAPAPAANIAPQKATASADGKTLWYNCKDLLVEGKGWTDTDWFYSRLPTKAQGRVIQPVWDLSHQSAGISVRFMANTSSVQVRWTLTNEKNLSMPHMPDTGASGIDLYAKDKDGRWRFVGNGRPDAGTNTAQFAPASGQPCLLYFPLYNGVASAEIGIPKESTMSVPDASTLSKPIVFYGTSITQGGCASRPGMAATAIVGRRLDVPVINLGFSGCGVMEQSMAELMAELDASAYVLDCLWNMVPTGVAERTEPFVKALRRAHPDTPIWLVEDSSVWGFCPTAKGIALREVYKKLTADGMKNVYFLSNEGMLGDDTEGTVDGTHLTDLGMMRQAETFIKAISSHKKPQ